MASKMILDSTTEPRRKLALIIGISEYASGQNLPNAINDANDMASALRRIGFLIDGGGPKLNLKRKDIRHTLVDFEDSIKEGDMILFYFAGHGRQWEDHNYLIPADNVVEVVKNGARVTTNISGVELKDRGVNAQDILTLITDKKPFVTIFLLDCCRMYHLRNKDLITRSEVETNNQPCGFKPMLGGVGSLIAFACAPGTLARDGEEGQRNGLFTKHLLKHITTPNEDIRMILADVTHGVMEESKSKQIPYLATTLISRNICLYEPAPEDQQFAPGKYSDYCDGRLCAKCGKCRDWYYTGDQKIWRWIQNYKNWKKEDEDRWDNGDYNKDFKKRDGAKCYYGGFFYFHGDGGGYYDHTGGDFYHLHGGDYGTTYDGCLCDDNRRT